MSLDFSFVLCYGFFVLFIRGMDEAGMEREREGQSESTILRLGGRSHSRNSGYEGVGNGDDGTGKTATPDRG